MDKIKRAFKQWGFERTCITLLILLSFVNAFSHWLWLVVALWQVNYLLALCETRSVRMLADDWEALADNWQDISDRWKRQYAAERRNHLRLIDAIVAEAEKSGFDVTEAKQLRQAISSKTGE